MMHPELLFYREVEQRRFDDLRAVWSASTSSARHKLTLLTAEHRVPRMSILVYLWRFFSKVLFFYSAAALASTSTTAIFSSRSAGKA